MDTSEAPDPREIAWRIDQYLKGDPLKDFSETEKQQLNTLAIILPEKNEFELGKEYALGFTRNLPNGTVPDEIRLVVSRGEIQQIPSKKERTGVVDTKTTPDPASLSPNIEGEYTVSFGKPGKQTVHCYHIDKTGKCLAWGMIEVNVAEKQEAKP